MCRAFCKLSARNLQSLVAVDDLFSRHGNFMARFLEDKW